MISGQNRLNQSSVSPSVDQHFHEQYSVVRLCADYATGLNAALETNSYRLPTLEEIFSKVSVSQLFSRIDLSAEYLQVEVDDESKKLLTINTHRGLFRFNRLAPGVISASGAFQQLMATMVSGLRGDILRARGIQPERGGETSFSITLQTFLHVNRSTPSVALNGKSPTQFYSSNNVWKWMPDTVFKAIGSVNYNILLDRYVGRRKVWRSHADQL